MDNALVRFINLAPNEVIDIICKYLEFSDFLSLTSISRHVRCVLANNQLFWLNFYMRRVNYRLYEESNAVSDKSTNKYELRMPSLDKKQAISDPANRLLNSARKVEIMKTDNTFSPNPMLNLSILDNFKRSRWRGEFKQYVENLSKLSLPTIVVPTLGSNPFLVISNNNVCGFNTSEDKFFFNSFNSTLTDYKRYEVKLCSWIRFDDVSYAETARLGNVTSRVGYVPKVLSVVYVTDYNSMLISFYHYNEESGFVNIPSMTVKTEVNKADRVSAIDVYGSLSSWDGRQISFNTLNLFLGTVSGKVVQKRIENGFVYHEKVEQVTSFEVTSLRFVSCYGKSVLVVFSSGNFLGVVDVSNDSWNLIEGITDSVVTFSVDYANCLMSYSTSFQNRATFLDLYNFYTEKQHYLVPKPPFSILSLERDSKWAIVIRNYIRVLQVIHPNNYQTLNLNNLHEFNCVDYEDGSDVTKSTDDCSNVVYTENQSCGKKKLKFNSICTLNGHVNEITQCVHDRWSKLVTTDTSHTLFVWDYTIGCKIFSFSLLSNIDRNVNYPFLNLGDFGKKRTNFKRIDSKSSIKCESLDSSQNGWRDSESYICDLDISYSKRNNDVKRSVNLINRIVSNSDTKDAIHEYLYFHDSDTEHSSPLNSETTIQNFKSDRGVQKCGRSKNVVPASNIKGLLDPNKKGQKYHVDVSVQSLIVYYKSYNVLQVWSFK